MGRLSAAVLVLSDALGDDVDRDDYDLGTQAADLLVLADAHTGRYGCGKGCPVRDAATELRAALELQAERVTGGWCVHDPCGGTWWPDEATQDHIQAAADPAAEAVRIASAEPMRGEWAQ